MKDPRQDLRYVHDWVTISVTALPAGWRNLYQVDGDWWTEPCPAILLEECRGRTQYWTEPGPDGKPRHLERETKYEAPLDTRAVFAYVDSGDPTLRPVDDFDGSGYIMTLAPDQEPEKYLRKTEAKPEVTE